MIVVANPAETIHEQSYANNTAYFQIFVVGAISHGYIPADNLSGILGLTPSWELAMQASLEHVDHYNDVIAFNWVKDSRTPESGLASADGASCNADGFRPGKSCDQARDQSA